MKLSLEACEVLDAIDRKGSFAAAAAALYRVPSTMTYTVQKLEEDLGIMIYRREGRRSILTPAGKVLLDQGRELLKAAQSIVETAKQVDSGWESHITIALDTIYDIEELYNVVEEFYKLQTRVEVNITEEVLAGSWDAIIENRADLVIGAPHPEINTQGIKFEEIKVADWQFVVGRNHPLLEYDLPLSEDDIKPFHSIIIKDSSKRSPAMTHRIFEKQTVLRVASMEQKISAQIRGLGVGFLPTHRITNHLETGELVSLKIAKDAPLTPLFIGWRTNNKGRAIRWFIDKFRECNK
ncbi:LysR family transcriptional regulator [Shewanella sp. SR44-4]|uniref:LysR family transcriptional regulator n=1 Tax=unclassified Shewanella TaxID=196818 RepID=UPI000C327EA7|nr:MULTISPECIES: LysR family transcriptional regulator [unclassified Shewanella]MBB1362145.1 LysR family transcriptional regulator [Shewanella sp. SR44-4]PKH33286.1 LysR family transcriptional regulator [Shewanella sp. ALD9]